MAIFFTGINIPADFFCPRGIPYFREGTALNIPDRIHQTAEKYFSIRINVKFIITEVTFNLFQESIRVLKISLKMQEVIRLIADLVSGIF